MSVIIAFMGASKALRISIPVLLLSSLAQGQWVNHPDTSLPRTKDGKPNLSAPAPRRSGKPDLSGIWQAESTSRKELSTLFPPGVGLLPGGENGLGEDDPTKYFLNLLADYKFGQEPFTPQAGKLFGERMRGGGPKPTTLCQPPTIPVAELLPEPFKIVQTPGLVLFLYEADQVFRQIFMDGRRHPADMQPSWLGYSLGRWEGDTMVVDAVGFNDLGPLDAMGHFHSDSMRVTQRFLRKDVGHMALDISVDDPKTFTKPIQVKVTLVLRPDTEIIESFCTEAEKDLVHITGAAGPPR